MKKQGKEQRISRNWEIINNGSRKLHVLSSQHAKEVALSNIHNLFMHFI